MSRELVTSIFLPDSPIHDGALIIQNGRITAAGCFLPLTTNPNVSKTLGTRHRAAIGLTEETDAVVIVVSEEDGTISLVREGKITRDIDGGDAAHHAAAAAGGMRLPSVRLRRSTPPAAPSDGEGRAAPHLAWRARHSAVRRRLREIIRHNRGLKLVSLLLACFLWYSINELERDAERVVEMPVAIRKVPSGLIVTELSPAKGVTVTLRGPRTILDSVDGREDAARRSTSRTRPRGR